MPTIDDAILDFAVSNNAATYAGQEDLSHAEVTVIAQKTRMDARRRFLGRPKIDIQGVGNSLVV